MRRIIIELTEAQFTHLKDKAFKYTIPELIVRKLFIIRKNDNSIVLRNQPMRVTAKRRSKTPGVVCNERKPNFATMLPSRPKEA